MKRNIIYLIDPQSVNSLGVYDYEMIHGITDYKIHFWGNQDYNHRPFNTNVQFTPLFKYGRFTNPVLKGISYVLSILSIILHAFVERPKIIHIQWIRIFPIDYGMIRLLQFFLGTKIIFTVHNILPHNHGKKSLLQYNKFYHTCDCLISHTKKCKQDLVKQFNIQADKITIMPHGCLCMDISAEDILHERKKFISEYHINGKIIISALGVQSPYKGTDLLLEAWTSNPELYDNDKICLIIAGKSSGIIYPDKLPKNVITISRILSNEEFEMIMQLTDVAILPYRAIEQSGVLLTLIQKGIPYCCTQVGELAYPIQIADIGWIIKDVSSKCINETLIKVISSPEIIKQKKSNLLGWNKIRDMYSWETSNKILQKTYSELL